MKACLLTNYKSPDHFVLQDVAKPVPNDHEVLIKVHASSINSWDWEILMGKPFVNRLMVGLTRPTKIKILGCDIAGQIEAVGQNVKQLYPGDNVFGDISSCGWGGFAEYVCVREDKNVLALKPARITFEQAAATPQAAVLALQGLRKGKIDQARKVLINGASGGVGSFAVQLAKSYGAEVTGVCRTQKMDFVRTLGADSVIDYTQEDFTTNGSRYDLILDVQGHHSVLSYKQALSTNGRYVMVGGSSRLALKLLLLGPLSSIVGSKRLGLLMHKPNASDLDIMKRYFEAGTVMPVIDRFYTLANVSEAFRYYGQGLAKGKVVITIMQDS